MQLKNNSNYFNQEKYSISEMCKFLEVTRSLIYHHLNKEATTNCKEESIIINYFKRIFKLSRNSYGMKKTKKELYKLFYQAYRRKISKIIKENAFVFSYI